MIIAQIGIIGFDGQIELDALQLYGQPLDAALIKRPADLPTCAANSRNEKGPRAARRRSS